MVAVPVVVTRTPTNRTAIVSRFNKDARPQHRLVLECGHEKIGAATSQNKKCHECRTMRLVVSVGELVRPEGGLKSHVQSRADGLTMVHVDGAEWKLWWCSICHGGHPHKAYRKRSESTADVFVAWDQHKVSPAHASNALVHFKVLDVADAIDRSSVGE